MLTEKEEALVECRSISALNSIQRMKQIITEFENPMREMTWGEFSRAMHRALRAYDYEKDEIEAICNAEFRRMVGDDDEEDEDE